jgi:CCR4-NOT transcriptional regulation complex NOT5 subunit
MDKLEQEKKKAIKELQKHANDRCRTWMNDIKNQNVSLDFSNRNSRSTFIKTPIFLTNNS